MYPGDLTHGRLKPAIDLKLLAQLQRLLKEPLLAFSIFGVDRLLPPNPQSLLTGQAREIAPFIVDKQALATSIQLDDPGRRAIDQ